MLTRILFLFFIIIIIILLIYYYLSQHLQKNMDLDSPYFLSSLVAIGHITQICPDEFSQDVKGIVAKFIVKELLMQDRVGVS